MAVVGIGLDIVDIETYARQLSFPGTTIRSNFTAAELTDAQQAANTDESLAGRWAAKEAVIKAWSSSRYGQSPKIASHLVRHNEIEVMKDMWSRPKIRLHGEFAKHMDGLVVHLSLSHDNNVAAAVVVIEEL